MSNRHIINVIVQNTYVKSQYHATSFSRLAITNISNIYETISPLDLDDFIAFRTAVQESSQPSKNRLAFYSELEKLYIM